MQNAIEQAKKCVKDVPIGCVIKKNGQIIASAHNRRELDDDITAHAEILAIKKACKKLNDFRLIGTELYVSLEPCVMCTGAILNARIDKVYFGASITNGSISSKELVERAELNHKTEIVGGFMREECSELVSSYFKSKRKKSDKV